MRKLILHMALTIDDVAAPEKKATDVFDFADEDVWRDLFTTLETVDAVLIGSAMHKEYLTAWNDSLTSPTAGPNERRYAEIAARTPHFILSRTLRKIEWPNASVLEGGVDGIAGLKKQAGGDIMMWGGPTAAGAAIDAGVIDEYQLVTHPVIAGPGKKLFGSVAETRRARHKETKVLPSGIVIRKYAAA